MKVWYYGTAALTLIYLLVAPGAFFSGEWGIYAVALALPLLTMWADLRELPTRIYEDTPPSFWVVACAIFPFMLFHYLFKRYGVDVDADPDATPA